MIDLYEWNIQEKMDGSVRESGTSIVRRICTNISRITFINFLKNIYFYVPIFFSDSLNQRKSFENHFTFFNSIVSLQFDENNSKSSNANQIRAKIIKIQIYKKKASNGTSSPNIILLRQTSPNTNCDSFPPSARQRGRDRPIHTTISRHIVSRKKKIKKGKSRARRNTILLQNLPTTDIFISAEEAARAAQFPRFLKRIFKVSSSPVDACLGNRLHRPCVTLRWNRWNKERY